MVKPIHPAAVHFPIAFLSLAYGLDILHTVRPKLPNTAESYVPANFDLTRASYYLLSLGLLSAIPAIITGSVEAAKLFSKQGLYEADGKTVRPKTKAVFAHAIFADITLLTSAYIWYSKKNIANDTLLGKLGVTAEAAYTPATWMVAVQAVLLGLLLFTANIGGNLTYKFGVGFSAAKSPSAKKAQ